MKTIRVNIKEFMEQHLSGAVIPADIMEKFNECFLRGEEWAYIRSTIYDEIKINAFYNEHPELRPQTDWEIIAISRKVIDLMKQYIKGVEIEDIEINEALKQTALIMDSRKVKGCDIDDIEDLYNDILWLKCETIK